MTRRALAQADLPRGRVETALVSSQDAEILQSLHSLGVETLSPPPFEPFGKLKSHTDMLTRYCGGGVMLVGSGQTAFADQMRKSCGITAIECKAVFGAAYPSDVQLNAAFVGKIVFCRHRSAAPELLKYAAENSFEIVNVGQGYAKCSVCIVNENAIITDDKSIFSAARRLGLDCLEISKGSVELPGFEYGFIGGCCGKLSPDIMAFTGELSTHTDGCAIRSFLNKHGVETLELRKGKLLDLGGIVPITELIF